ncbi:hypothetical protein [Sulfuracidifex tepidarius]|uniref:Uncharacterized protein n=1 Tax=Sulfuracidifex tepidarius TaxID=1294262 RepID=A0A510E5X4_9CREN|nr:hypothetical protein [Sulfuracidifex tepidarius]BBG25117.1 hypothetical protein IC006_2452 [Sulfuracidifex tepidarius]BBG27899.1 hypothetical protein IC007_2454 [Sulfuracidifex tepidarius]
MERGGRRRNDAAYFIIILTYILAVASHPALVSLTFLPIMALHGFTIDKNPPKGAIEENRVN